ncbi:50S ribosomal protein L30 [Eremococcus coleocola]|uniref:Large ribosomal subunit protein uL30 n=1 Tax=Eremococcus coleocola ACS-139-V-Col8 TaxID=908337 RepID=E4KMQ4_9LACT|nr:50S ribosomal protein L30 [Eremococcus coleocola]EFR31761.1 ribosomal protein L30 [Eremococcus coleocola ACS-139-V-Col8]
MANLEIKLTKSLFGRPKNQVDTAKSLGLTRPNRVVVKADSEQVRNMLKSISHLVEVKEA